MNNRLIAIGDIHSCYYSMVDLFNELNIDFCQDKVIFLGDYIDRGPHSVKVLKTIKELQRKYPNNVVALLGNHEQMCVDYYIGTDKCWIYNSCGRTWDQLEELTFDERNELLQWMKHLPSCYETENYRFCHSGNWLGGYDAYGYEDILWDRHWINNPELNDNTKPIIFGHTPLKEPTYCGKHLGIDCGVCFGNKLAAAVIENGKIETISVPTNKEDLV